MAGGLMQPTDRRRRGQRFRPMSEINVTPFVDVMLVLLVVFMVSAPLLIPGEPVDLPRTESTALPTESAPLPITVARDGTVYLGGAEGGEATLLDALPEKLNAIVAERGQDADQVRIFIRGDEGADYGAVVAVMARVRAAGFVNVGLVTNHIDR